MKKIVVLFLTMSSLFSISAFTYLNSTSVSLETGSLTDHILSSTGIAYETGSPSDNTYCADCHSGGTSTPTLAISASPAFGTGNTYIASATYTITVTCSGSYPKYGFDLEILNTNAATLAADQGTFIALANSQIVSDGIRPTNLSHIAPTGSGNTANFSFAWTAPSSGTAYLYCACIGANLDSSYTGDQAIKTSITLTQSTAGIALHETNISDINIFPNPATDKLNVNFTLLLSFSVSMDMFDINGNKIRKSFMEPEMNGEVHKSYDISSYPKGIYFLELNVDGKSSLYKIIKL